MPELDAPSLHLRNCGSRDGLGWVRKGIGVCAQRPLGFGGLFTLVFMISMMLSALPLIGPLLVVTAMPYLWLVFMAATRRTLHDRPFGLDTFTEVLQIDPLRKRSLFHLCTLYLVLLTILMLLASAISPGAEAWQAVMQADPDKREALMMNPDLALDLLIRFALTTPLTLAFWHAPALVQSMGLSASKALFFSWMACWHNRWAFLVYALSWISVLFGSLTVADLLAALFESPAVAGMLAVPVLIWVGASFYASLYFTTVECFEAKLVE